MCPPTTIKSEKHHPHFPPTSTMNLPWHPEEIRPMDGTSYRMDSNDSPGSTISFPLYESRFFLKRRASTVWITNSNVVNDSQQPGETNEAKRRKLHKNTKSVRFNETPKVAYRHHNSDDHQQAWYNAADYDSFKDECRQALLHVDSVNGNLARIDHKNHCIRGLEEQINPRLYFLRKKRKSALIRTILKHQELSRSIGFSDAKKLKLICLMYSQQSKEWAKELAVLDVLSNNS